MLTIKITDDDREAEMLNKAKDCYIALFKISNMLRRIRKDETPVDIEGIEAEFYEVLDEYRIDLDTLA